MSETAERALVVLLQRLSSPERAAYLLRKAFDYPYGRIAEVLPCTATNARQLVRRAQLRLSSAQSQPVSAAARRRLVRGFAGAAQMGEFAGLEALLVADIRRASRRSGDLWASVTGRSRRIREAASAARCHKMLGSNVSLMSRKSRQTAREQQEETP